MFEDLKNQRQNEKSQSPSKNCKALIDLQRDKELEDFKKLELSSSINHHNSLQKVSPDSKFRVQREPGELKLRPIGQNKNSRPVSSQSHSLSSSDGKEAQKMGIGQIKPVNYHNRLKN